MALGLALVQYGREEAAEPLIEQMTRDQVCLRVVEGSEGGA